MKNWTLVIDNFYEHINMLVQGKYIQQMGSDCVIVDGVVMMFDDKILSITEV